MFTIEQIKTAHSKVKSGADFPEYVQEIKKLGVLSYDNYVADGRTNYYGMNDFSIAGGSKYPTLSIAATSSDDQLKQALIIHQQGQTDYLSFCKQAAEAGVEKWTVHVVKMNCTYYDKNGREMYVEAIPNV